MREDARKAGCGHNEGRCMDSWLWPPFDSFSVSFARQFLSLNLLMTALHFDLVLDLSLMVYIAMGMPVQGSKWVAWTVLALLILSLTSFTMGWSRTFMSAQYCADIFLNYPPCQLDYLFIAASDLLHAFVRCRDMCAFIVAARSTADHPCILLYTCALMYAASQA